MPPKVSKIEASNEVAKAGWFNAIYKLSGGQFLKRTEVLLQPISEAFGWLIYESVRSYDEAVTTNLINKSK